MRYLLPRLEELPLWPVISGVVFLALFLTIAFFTYRSSAKKSYSEIEKLPLSED